MPTVLNVLFCSIFCICVASCASVQERKALHEWKEERRNFLVRDIDDARLPELSENATLDDYILYALVHNAGLRAAFDRWKASLERVAPARTLPDPRFTYVNYIREVETRVGAQERKFGFAQTIPWFGKLDLRGKIAVQSVNAVQQSYEKAKLNLIYRIKKVYYEYCYLIQAINITKDNVVLLTHFESVARSKYRGGVGLQIAVIKAQVELGKLEDRLSSLLDLTRSLIVKLNMALNRPSHLPLPEPKEIPTVQSTATDTELYLLLRTQNPELKAFDFLVAKEGFAVELAKKNYYPDMTFGVDYIDTASRTDINPDDNGKDPILAKVTINVPIWHRKYDALKNEAKARRRSVTRERKEKENSLITDLEIALYKLRDADRKIKLYGDTLLLKAEQNVKVTQLAFTANKAGFLDLIDSQRIFLGFQLEYKRALADQAQRFAEIEMLTGGPMRIANKE